MATSSETWCRDAQPNTVGRTFLSGLFLPSCLFELFVVSTEALLTTKDTKSTKGM